MRTSRTTARTLLALSGTALLVPLVAAPAEGRPELPAVVPAELSQADQAAVDAEAVLAAAVQAETEAAAVADSSAAAVETATAALAEVDAQLAELGQALRAAEQRAGAASGRVAALAVAVRATEAARDLEPVLLAGAGAGAAGVVGVVGHSVAVEPLASRAAGRLAATRDEVEVATGEVHRLRADRAELMGARWTAAGDVAEAQQAHDAATVESDRAAAAARSSRDATTVAAASALELRESVAVDSRLVRPGTGEVSSIFGMRRHPVTGVTKPHTGVDFLPGDGVAYAAAAGTVASVEHDPAYGLIVVVAHGSVDGEAVTTAYAHLSSAEVAAGDEVDAGRPLGRIGSTGMSTGPHLHFEIRVADTAVDPMPWLGG